MGKVSFVEDVMKQGKKEWMLLSLALASSVAMSVSAAEGPALETITKSYGPIIQVTGTPEEIANKIHSGWGDTKIPQTVDLRGTVVAYGAATKVSYDGGEKSMGMNDNKPDEVMKIHIHANLLKGHFFDENYKKRDLATGKWVEPNIKTGDLVIKDPIVAKAEMGGTIELSGKDMHFNLLYAHKNQYTEEPATEELTSRIHVNLTGDLIAGDENQDLKNAEADWLKQAHIAGGLYAVGNIETGTGDGEITVRARNITAQCLRTHEESLIDLAAKDKLAFTNAFNTHESSMRLMGKTITGDTLITNSWDAHTIAGNSDTESIHIRGNVGLTGGASTLHMQAKEIRLGGFAGTDVKSSAHKADVATVQASESLHLGGSITGEYVKATFTSGNAVTLGLRVGSDVAGVALKEGAHIAIQGKTVTGNLGNVKVEPSSDDKKQDTQAIKSTLRIVTKGGDLTAQDIRMMNSSGDITFQGFDTLSVNSMETNTESLVGNVYTPSITLIGKEVHLGYISNTRGNFMNSKPVDASLKIRENSTVSIIGKESVRIDGNVSNIGTVTISAPSIHAYRIGAGGEMPEESVVKQATTYVNADSLVLDTAASAHFSGGHLVMTVKDLQFNPEGGYHQAGMVGKYPTSPDAKASWKDEGLIWASHGGTVDLKVHGGTFTGATAVRSAAFSERAFDDRIRETQRNLADYKRYVEKIPKMAAVYGDMIRQYEGKIATWNTVKKGGPGTVNVMLTPGSTWLVTRDSAVTNLHNDGTVVLSESLEGGQLSQLTAHTVMGDGEMLFKVHGGAVSTFTADRASGTWTVGVIDNEHPDLQVAYPKTVLATIKDKKDLMVKPAHVFLPNHLFGYVTPVHDDAQTIYLEGTYVKDPGAITSEVVGMRTASGLMTDALYHMSTSSLYNEAVPQMSDSWASVNRAHVKDAGMMAKETRLAVGVPVHASLRSTMGVAYRLDTMNLDANIDTKLHEAGVYGTRNFGHGMYVAGDMYMGRMSQSFFGNHAHRFVHGMHVEFGKTMQYARAEITPVVGLAYVHAKGYTMTQSPFEGTVDKMSAWTMKAGVHGTYQFTDAWALRGKLVYHKPLRTQGTLTLCDGIDTARVTAGALRGNLTLGMGATYQQGDTTLSLDISKTHGGHVTSNWNVGLTGSIRF